MTKEGNNNGLENLFRKKLEENEVSPSGELTDRFMRRLGRREFIRFNPGRMNIYYLAAGIALLTVASLLFINSGRGDEADVIKNEETIRTIITSDESNIEESAEKTAEDKGVIINDKPSVAEKRVRNTAASSADVQRETIINPQGSSEKTISVNTADKAEATLAVVPECAFIEASVTSGCVPLRVQFACNREECSDIKWNFGDGGSSTDAGPAYMYDIPGTYNVTLTCSDGKGTTSTATTVIEVWDKPVAAFEVKQDEHFNDDETVTFINQSTGATEYLWNFGDGATSDLSEPSYKYSQSGTYDVTLIAYSSNGCTDSATVNDILTGRGMYIRFPNAFTPNRGGPTGGYYNRNTDEDNRVFHPVASGIDRYNLKIYSKSGLLVFESDDIAMGWDGYYKGGLCSSGVYIWKLRGRWRDGRPIIMAGDVTLLHY